MPGAERLAEQVSGDDEPAALARWLLRNVWMVDRLDEVADDFDGVAVTRRDGCSRLQRASCDRQPQVGEERVLAERNRRDVLIAASEAAVQSEQSASVQVEAAVTEASRLDGAREAAIAAHRSAAVAARRGRRADAPTRCRD